MCSSDLPETPPSVPPPPASLTFVAGAGGEQGAEREEQEQEGHGVARAGQGPDRSPREPQARLFPLGGGMQGLSKEGRDKSRQQAETERSLPPTLVHTADLSSPPTWAAEVGDWQRLLLLRSGARRPGSLSHAHPIPATAG